MALAYTVEDACAEKAYLKKELRKAMKTMKDHEEDLQQIIAADNLSDSSIQQCSSRLGAGAEGGSCYMCGIIAPDQPLRRGV